MLRHVGHILRVDSASLRLNRIHLKHYIPRKVQSKLYASFRFEFPEKKSVTALDTCRRLPNLRGRYGESLSVLDGYCTIVHTQTPLRPPQQQQKPHVVSFLGLSAKPAGVASLTACKEVAFFPSDPRPEVSSPLVGGMDSLGPEAACTEVSS